MNKLGSEVAAIVATIDPDASAAGTYTSDYVDMGKFAVLLAVIQLGILGAAATIDAKLVQATDAAGTGKKDITGKAVTQLVKATDDDKQALINMRAEDVDINGGFAFVALEMTTVGGDSDLSALLLGLGARYEPANNENLASVAEIV